MVIDKKMLFRESLDGYCTLTGDVHTVQLLPMDEVDAVLQVTNHVFRPLIDLPGNGLGSGDTEVIQLLQGAVVCRA